MPTHGTPSRLLAALSRQHAELRDGIARCEQLADDFDAGLLEPARLLQEVTALRIALDEHNRYEERALRPVLLDLDWVDAVRIPRIVEKHVEEHRAIRRDLDTWTASELRAVLTSLREHLDVEERYLLARKALRDDLAG